VHVCIFFFTVRFWFTCPTLGSPHFISSHFYLPIWSPYAASGKSFFHLWDGPKCKIMD